MEIVDLYEDECNAVETARSINEAANSEKSKAKILTNAGSKYDFSLSFCNDFFSHYRRTEVYPLRKTGKLHTFN